MSLYLCVKGATHRTARKTFLTVTVVVTFSYKKTKRREIKADLLS